MDRVAAHSDPVIVDEVDERDSRWEDRSPRFRVCVFEPSDSGSPLPDDGRDRRRAGTAGTRLPLKWLPRAVLGAS